MILIWIDYEQIVNKSIKFWKLSNKGYNKVQAGKVTNAGQTCVAPDYLLIHKDVKERFIREYKKALEKFFQIRIILIW